MGALIGAIHDVRVGPLEIEGIVQGFAQPRIGKLGAPGIENPALPTRWRIVRNFAALHATVADGGKIVTRGPGARGKFLAEEVNFCLESFEADIAVAIEFVAECVEVVVADTDRKLGSPPIVDPLILDIATRFKAADPVGAGTKRNFERRLVEWTFGVVGT